jgi:hypothetical protein
VDGAVLRFRNDGSNIPYIRHSANAPPHSLRPGLPARLRSA